MIQPNDSHSTNGAGYSAFASAQTALARKPLPGPIWAWPIVAAVAAAGLVYLVTSGSEHAPPRAKQDPAATVEGGEVAASTPGTAVTPEPSVAPTPSAEATAAAPAAPGEAAPGAAPASDGAAAPAAAAAEATAGEDTAEKVASAAAPTTKKKARAARKASRKRTAQVD